MRASHTSHATIAVYLMVALIVLTGVAWTYPYAGRVVDDTTRPACFDECGPEGYQQCNGRGIITCKRVDGCLRPVVSECPGGQICNNGQCAGQPNLVITGLTWDVHTTGFPESDSGIAIKATVDNIGDATAPAGFTISMESPGDKNYPTGFKGTSRVDTPMAPGERRYIPVGGSYLFNSASGASVPLTVFADIDNMGSNSNRVVESKEYDNTYFAQITIAPKARNVPCTDSDGGKGYAVKGVGTGEYVGGGPVIWGEDGKATFVSGPESIYYDHCATANQLNEAYCDSSGKLSAEAYQCPYGCSMGRCNPAVVQTCSDSDNGQDFSRKGRITETTSGWDDFCDLTFAGKNLREYYCDANGYGQSVAYNCPYGCKNGACLSAPGTVQYVSFSVSDMIARFNAAGVTVTVALSGMNGQLVLAGKSFPVAIVSRVDGAAIQADTNFDGTYDSVVLPGQYLDLGVIPGEGCTDSDSNNIMIRGTTKAAGALFEDVCLANGYVREGVCENNKLQTYDFPCQYGCNAGRCEQQSCNIKGDLASELREGDTKTYSMSGVDYRVTLRMVSDAGTEAKFMINGEEVLMHPCKTATVDGGRLLIAVNKITGDARGSASFALTRRGLGCTDADGRDVTVAGSAQAADGSGANDYCSSESTVNEAVCNGESFQHVSIACPINAPYCNRGKCQATRPACTDSDGGDAPKVRGTAAYAWGQDGPEYTDYCEIGAGGNPAEGSCRGSNCMLREYSCASGAYSPSFRDVACPQGCVSGACTEVPAGPSTPQPCTDSDGRDKYVQGTTVFDDAAMLDRCENSHLVQEFICENGRASMVFMDCEGACQEGKCTGTAVLQPAQACCVFGETCIPLGTRVEGRYCHIDESLRAQKAGSAACENSYECASNFCLDGACTEPGFFQRMYSALQRIFG